MASKPLPQLNPMDDDVTTSSHPDSMEDDDAKSADGTLTKEDVFLNSDNENGKSVESDETSLEAPHNGFVRHAEDDATSSGSEIFPNTGKSSTTIPSKPRISFSINSKEKRNVTSTEGKPRLKLRLKLPTMKDAQAKRPLLVVKKTKLPLLARCQLQPSSSTDSSDEGEINEVQALVVDDDEEAGEVEILSTAVDDLRSAHSLAMSSAGKSKVSIVDSSVKKDMPHSNVAKVSITTSSNRKSSNPGRQIRIPPIPSPGLYIPSSTSAAHVTSARSKNGAGFVSPREIFDASMEASGCTFEKRNNQPHRGSSVKRTVDDIFDSNVAFTANFPKLAPHGYFDFSRLQENQDISAKLPKKEGSSLESKISSEKNDSHKLGYGSKSYCEHILCLLNKSIDCEGVESLAEGNLAENVLSQPRRKRKRPKSFFEMMPVSLTLPFPDKFMDDTAQYVLAVKVREKAIVQWQEAQEHVEAEIDTLEAIEGDRKKSLSVSSKKNPVTIPAIPLPPDSFRIDELSTYEAKVLYDRDSHPYNLPVEKELVSHLDLSCFHITEGRYFGLSTNFVSDPNFVGANAPGIAGVSSSGTTGLATSTVSGVNSNVGAIFNVGTSPSLAVQSGSIGPKSDDKRKTTIQLPKSDQTNKKSQTSSTPSTLKSSPSKKQSSGSSSTKKSSSGAKPTASSADLRKIMEEGGSVADKFRVCIMRAAVHSSRLGKHGQQFIGPDGETYPDVSKSFALHAAVKPCQRCKNNKQGVYHCRLRRRHVDPDFDGGKSASLLTGFFNASMTSLME